MAFNRDQNRFVYQWVSRYKRCVGRNGTPLIEIDTGGERATKWRPDSGPPNAMKEPTP
jgi:hypothetical protein